jgi:hypothetical protein
MLHLIFISTLVVILANVVATIVISATVMRVRKVTFSRVIQGRAWRSPGGDCSRGISHPGLQGLPTPEGGGKTESVKTETKLAPDRALSRGLRVLG